MKLVIKNIIKKSAKIISCGPLSPIAAAIFQLISNLEYRHFDNVWKHTGWQKPKEDEIDFVCKNVTVIFKSFERQKMAKRLYENLQDYYPGVPVIIADDSSTPLLLQGDSLEISNSPSTVA